MVFALKSSLGQMDFRLVNAIVYNGLSFYSANLGVNSYLGFFISAAVEVA